MTENVYWQLIDFLCVKMLENEYRNEYISGLDMFENIYSKKTESVRQNILRYSLQMFDNIYYDEQISASTCLKMSIAIDRFCASTCLKIFIGRCRRIS